MKQKIYLFLTALLMMATTSAWADVTQDGVTYSVSGSTATLTNGSSANGDITIPATITDGSTTYDVTGVAKYAFHNNKNITSVTFKSTKLLLNQDAVFQGCTKLTSVSFANGTEATNGDLGAWFFEGCTSLTSIELPEKILWINSRVFQGCTSLTAVIIPTTVTQFKDYVFNNTPSLKTLIIRSSDITSIYSDAFSGATPSNISVVVPDASLDDYKTRLESFGFSSIITETNYYAQFPFPFSKDYENAKWFQMRIKSTLYCQYNSSNHQVEFTSTPTTGEDADLFAFVGTPLGFKIYNKAAGENAPFGPASNTGSAITAGSASDAGTFVFEHSTESGYEKYQLLRYKNGATYYLNVKDNNHLAVWNSSGNRHDNGSNFVFMDATNIQDGKLYYELRCDGTAWLTASNSNKGSDSSVGSDVVVPATVTNPANNKSYRVAGLTGQTFYNNKTIKSLRFESASLDYYTYTNDALFQWMTHLESITLPPPTDGTTKTLRSWAFANCNKLATIEIPEGFETIGGSTFRNCAELESLTLPSTLTSFGDYILCDGTFSSSAEKYYIYCNPTSVPTFGSNNENIANAIVVVLDNDSKSKYDNTTTWSAANAIITTAEKAILDGTSEDKNGLVYVSNTSSTLEGNNIVKGGSTCDNLVLTDGYSFTPSAEFTATNATYRRDINKGTEWVTVCLPFAVETAPDGVEFYKVENINKSTITVESTTSLEAGQPALLHRTSSDKKATFTFSGSGKVVKNPVTSTDGLVGSFTNDTKITADGTYYINSNVFKSKNTNFYIDAFRAYLQTNSSGADSPSFNILVDDDPTGISNATGADDAAEIEGIYSVSGVKQSDLQKGINIVRYRNGKTQKVILK